MELVLPLPVWAWIAGIALLLELGLALTARPANNSIADTLRKILPGLAILGLILMVIFPRMAGGWLPALVFLMALAEQAISRWLFYAQRMTFPISSR